MIYLDNSATTKIRDEALDTYVSVSKSFFGNPSSLHSAGYDAEKILKDARAALLNTLGDRDSKVVFCGSGSECNNLAILGRAYAKERFKKGGKIITSDSEHPSVNEPLRSLEAEGFKVVRIPTVGGVFDLEAFRRELTPDVILVTVMLVNNETGALYDVPAIKKAMGGACRDALLHVDATQGYLKIPFTKKSLGADMITVSSHKIEGPKGVGALIIDKEAIKRRDLSPVILGGGQEDGLRSGTENVPGIAAFAEAARLGFKELNDTISRLSSLKARLTDKLNEMSDLGIKIISPKVSSPAILSLILPSIKSETMLHYLSSKGVFVSSGSACSSNSQHKESAAVSFGFTPQDADSMIRVSMSRTTVTDDVDGFADALLEGISKLARIKR